MAKKRSLTRIFKRKTTDEATRFYAMHHGVPWTQAYIAELDNDNDDDARLIESFPTIATVDDNPGTGRTVDKYFFQPIGRKIERFAMRITITSLPPWKISQYFDTTLDLYVNVVYSFHSNIGQALAGLGELKRGSTIIAGLKSLVKQTQ